MGDNTGLVAGADVAGEMRDPVEFCPAAACAAVIVRLERFADDVERLAARARAPEQLKQLEAVAEELATAADEARDKLAEVEAVSAAGAMAQLLSAIRDVRVQDDAERERAKDLEARAVRFLSDARLFDAAFCSKLSHTKLGRRLTRSAPSAAGLPAHSRV